MSGYFSDMTPEERAEFERRYEALTALAAGSGTAKTAKPVECEASHSGPKGNAQTQSQHPKGNN